MIRDNRPAKRIRGRKLQQRRQRVLAKQPLCVMCQAEGKVTAAVHLDHIVALANGGPDTEDNVQPLCSRCHDVKTAKDLGYREKPTLGPDGWPIGRA